MVITLDFEQIHRVASILPPPQQRKFWLVGIDVTPLPRPFAPTLGDRTFVYRPNTIGGNKPVAMGHQYSALVVFPEKEGPYAPPWAVPRSVCRVSSQQTPNEVGANQIEMLMVDPTLPFYGQRYDEEHFFRFGRQRLLMDAYQTPDVEHEGNWWQIVSLAYVQLWLARSLAETMPRRWEKYLPQCKNKVSTPSFVQRDFARIIQQIGTPAKTPKPRGKSPGRAKGTRPERRERQPVIKKSKKGRKSRSKAAQSVSSCF